jgi:cytochrome P450
MQSLLTTTTTAIKHHIKLLFTLAITIFIIRYREFLKYLFIIRPHMVNKLPSPKGYKQHYLFGHMPDFLQGVPFDPEHLTHILVRRVQEISYNNREAGFVRIRGFNENIPFFNNVAICFVTNIDTARELLATKVQPDWKKGMAYDVSDQLIGNSVLRSVGKEWEIQRKIVEKGFAHVAMENVMDRVVKTCQELVNKWENGIHKAEKQHDGIYIANVRIEMLKFTMDVISRSAFNYDCNSITAERDEDAPLYLPFQTILLGLERRGQFLHEHFTRFLPTKRNIELNAAIAKLDGIVDKVLTNRREKPVTVDNRKDFLDILLEHAGGGGGGSGSSGSTSSDGTELTMSDKILKDNLKTLLFAGHDTTAAALANLLYLIAGDENVMKTLKQEIDTIIGRNNDPTYEQLELLDHLNSVVLETLRLYPSAGFTRSPAVDTTLLGYQVPRKTEILILPYVYHRDPTNWDRPDEFIPDRFLKEGFEYSTTSSSSSNSTGENNGGNSNTTTTTGEDDVIIPNSPDKIKSLKSFASSSGAARINSLQSRIARISRNKAYIPFSAGPRNCVGRPLALMEMRVCLVKLLQRFTFERVPDPDYDPVPVLTLTLNPASIKLRVNLDV